MGLRQTVGVLIFPVFKQRTVQMESRHRCSRSTNHKKRCPAFLSLLSARAPSAFTPPLAPSAPPSPSQPSILTSAFLPLLSLLPPPAPLPQHSPLTLSLPLLCPLQRPSLARQGWLQIRSSAPWGEPMGHGLGLVLQAGVSVSGIERGDWKRLP